MYNSNDIAKRIKEIAKIRHIKITDMFEYIGLGKNTLNNFKTSMPKSDNLAKIADYLDCSVDYLLGRTDDPNLYFLDCSSIMNHPNLMKMYKPLPVYPSADYVIPRIKQLSSFDIKEAVVRRDENTEKANFIVHFQSNRMEPIYNEGDYLLIEKTDHINIGEIGIFVIDKIRAFVLKKEKASLTFANPRFPPFSIDNDVYCAGRVIGTIDLHYSKQRWKK